MPNSCQHHHAVQQFLERRPTLTCREFGAQPGELAQAIANELETFYRGELSVTKLLMQPRIAARFCEQVRMARGWLIPDDVILRQLQSDGESHLIDTPSAAADPLTEGVALSTSQFLTAVAQEFVTRYEGTLTFREFQLWPQEAIRFCDHLRERFDWFFLSDFSIMDALRLRAGVIVSAERRTGPKK